MNTFTINGKKYNAKAIDFNAVCVFEDLGLEFTTIQKKSNSFTRAYFSICAGIDLDTAGKEIEKHIIAGGDTSEIASVFAKEIEESDFFRALSKNQIQEDQNSNGKKKA